MEDKNPVNIETSDKKEANDPIQVEFGGKKEEFLMLFELRPEDKLAIIWEGWKRSEYLIAGNLSGYLKSFFKKYMDALSYSLYSLKLNGISEAFRCLISSIIAPSYVLPTNVPMVNSCDDMGCDLALYRIYPGRYIRFTDGSISERRVKMIILIKGDIIVKAISQTKNRP